MLFVLLFAPLYQGYLERLRARLFLRVGPPLVQPFRDQRKWSSKGTVRGTHTTWVSAIAPTIYFCAPLIVAILMPVLTRNPLPLAFMADMLGGGGCILTAGGFFLLAALDAGSPFATLGASRIRLVGVFTEPLIIFAAAAVGRSTNPFAVNAALGRAPWL